MTEATLNPASYRSPGRPGTSTAHILAAADAILRKEKIPPTVRLVAQRAGASATTVAPVMKGWWKSLGERLEAGPAALQRIPEGSVHILEALYLQLKEDARQQLLSGQQVTREQLDQARSDIEVRSHVLTLREGELDNRLRDRERAFMQLEQRMREVLALLAKEQALHAAATRRIQQLEARLAEAPPFAPPVGRGPRVLKARRRAKRRSPSGKTRIARLSAHSKSQKKTRSKPLNRPKRAKRALR